MQGRCEKHLFEVAEDRCGMCGLEFCAECLVYSFGPKRPPYCIPCAVSAAGIRTSASRGPLPRREAKRLERERKSAFRQAERLTQARPVPEVFEPMAPPRVDSSPPLGIPVGQGFPAQA
jgi:hypothetical protein